MKRLPSTDLYFLNACRHAVRGLPWRKPVRQIGPNSFATPGSTLLVRRDRTSVMKAVLEQGPRQLHYLIDDDIQAARDTASLPQDYRRRLVAFEEGFHRQLVRRADTLIVTSDALEDRFRWHGNVQRLDPVWHLEPADDRHFDVSEGAPIEIVHLGSGSHAGAHQFLRLVIEALLSARADIRFTYFGAEPAMGVLDHDPRVRRLTPKRWRSYRRWVGKQRFHLALYPLPDTAFDRSRSVNKLIEHAIVGAAAIYSAEWRDARIAAPGALTAETKPASWTAAILANLSHARLKQVYRETKPIVQRLNDPSRQRSFWSRVLAVDL